MIIKIERAEDYPENRRGEKMYYVSTKGNSFTQVQTLSEAELQDLTEALVNFTLNLKQEETKNAGD
jgi:hypothetical protein